jgi:hypothetical protein
MNPQESDHCNPSDAICVTRTCRGLQNCQREDIQDATISHVEADGIVLRTKTGISKVYFAELPKDVQERFRYGSATPTGKAVTQRIDKAESANHAAEFFDAGTFADRFAQKVEKKLDERESILQGKHTPGPAESMVIREFNWQKAFLASTGIICQRAVRYRLASF